MRTKSAFFISMDTVVGVGRFYFLAFVRDYMRKSVIFVKMNVPELLKKTIYLSLSMLFAVGCGNAPRMTITGTAPAGSEGFNVYLVPQPYPVAEEVDSTVVRDGKFSFEVKADPVRVCDITISRKANVPFERLLIVVEPGTLQVTIDSISNGSGTPLNEELALWKRTMSDCGERAMMLRREKAEQDDPQIADSLAECLDRVYAEADSVTMALIERNPNPLGGFLYMIAERGMDEARLARLKAAGIDKWKPERRNERKQ